jgi:hypothetical protein
MVEDNVVRFIGAYFMHNHDLSIIKVSGANDIDNETRMEIQHLTELGFNAGQVRLRLGLTVSPHVPYNIRRDQLRQYRTSQANKLQQEISKSSDFETCLPRDGQHFAGCDFFHTIFSGTPVLHETLIMDDTSCTNRYGFPILVILGIDEYRLSQ